MFTAVILSATLGGGKALSEQTWELHPGLSACLPHAIHTQRPGHSREVVVGDQTQRPSQVESAPETAERGKVGVGGEGRSKREGVCVYTYTPGRFPLLYGRNQRNIVKQSSSN